jgi:hypothetical protein
MYTYTLDFSESKFKLPTNILSHFKFQRKTITAQENVPFDVGGNLGEYKMRPSGDTLGS